jgi:hypothetical protein
VIFIFGFVLQTKHLRHVRIYLMDAMGQLTVVSPSILAVLYIVLGRVLGPDGSAC